jgi:hypothetical protein
MFKIIKTKKQPKSQKSEDSIEQTSFAFFKEKGGIATVEI